MGSADVAADGRIADTMDNLDRKYYQSDAIHPTDAGYAVMAADTAPVLNAFSGTRTSANALQQRRGRTDRRGYAARTTWELAAGGGTKTMYAASRPSRGRW
jgi:hypothetical protein